MKFVLLLCISVIFSVALHAQSWDQLNTEFIEFWNNGDFDKAITVGEKAKLAAKKEFGAGHQTYALSLYNLATAYLETGEYKKAEPLFVQAKAIQQKTPGEKHPDYAATLNDMARLYTETKQYAKAEPLYLQAKQIRGTAPGENHPDYSTTLNDLATLYVEMKQYTKAESLYLQSKQITEKTTGTSDPEYITTISNLALLYEDMNLYEKAETLYIEANKFYQQHPGENDADYDASLDGLASLYDKMGQYAKAEEYYMLSAAVNKKQSGEISAAYAKVINRLALIYTAMAEYDKAEQLYLQIAAIRKTVLGDGHPDYGTALNNLASHYLDLGLYEKAESYYLQAIDIAEQNPDKNNTDYLTFVNNVAMLYMKKGKYEMAEPLLIKLKEAKKNVFGKNHPSYAVSLSNLANVYFTTGQYEKTIPIYTTAMAVIKKVVGEQNPDYLIPLQNLAYVYATMGQSAKAESLYLQGMAIRKKISGENHPDYATLSDNLALLYSNMGEYLKAGPLYTRAKNIRKQLFGEMHPDYASSLNNLAYYYMDAEKYDTAEILFTQTKEIMKKTLGEEHPGYAVALNNLSDLYVKTGQFKKAEPGLIQSANIFLQNMLHTFTVLSESEKNNYLEKNTSVFETNNSFLYRYKNASPEMIINNFNLQLAFKSASLSDTKNMMESLLNNPDSSMRKLISTWMTNRDVLAKQYSLPAANRRNDLEKINEQAEAGEKELNMLSSEFRNQQNTLQVSMQDVQKNLQPGEVAIEFVRFQLLNKQVTDSMIYAAYVVHKDNPVPVFIPLCEEKQLIKILSPKSVSNENIKALYRSEIAGDEEQKIELGDSLYALIWKPLFPYLQGVKKIDYSPVGLLHKLAFHALPTGDTQLLVDKYELRQFTNLKQIVEVANQTTIAGNIALFGDCAFTMDSISMVKNIAAGKTGSTIYSSGLSRSGNHQAWANLPGTAKEITAIQSLFEKNKIHSSASYTKQKTTEEQFKSLSGNSPTILHLATHGFFLPDPDKKKREGLQTDNRNAFTLADDPLLRSGIILSGANRVWSGRPPIEGREDGILTAYEISQLDLSKTHLVVLSACETALGDIKGNEGVFGLQRAFKLAGVKNMILSLWRVPDAETAELMTTFYNYYIQGNTIREAFNAAQKDMRAKYKPYYWAAFVLIE